MRHDLPAHPHIDHLKKQAKDLLEGHKSAQREALERIIAHLPAFARLSVEEAAKASFALHDAQSAVAREYGFASWNELREEVERRASRAVPDSVLRSLAGRPLPLEVRDALSNVWSERGRDEPEPPAGPVRLPLLAFRGAMLTPGAVAPINVARPSSIAALEAALASSPAQIAVFTQRDAAVEDPALTDLHPVGCVAVVHKRIPAEGGTLFVVVQGQWWATLEGLARPEGRGFMAVEVMPLPVVDESSEAERSSLIATLRDRAHTLARGMPQPERVVTLIDSIRVPASLADLVVANLPCPVEDKARYAALRSLAERLRAAIALCEAQLGAAGATG